MSLCRKRRRSDRAQTGALLDPMGSSSASSKVQEPTHFPPTPLSDDESVKFTESTVRSNPHAASADSDEDAAAARFRPRPRAKCASAHFAPFDNASSPSLLREEALTDFVASARGLAAGPELEPQDEAAGSQPTEFESDEALRTNGTPSVFEERQILAVRKLPGSRVRPTPRFEEFGWKEAERPELALSSEEVAEEGSSTTAAPTPNVQSCDSKAESAAEADEEAEAVCRFCFSEEGPDLISPCRCRGTQKFVHRSCLNEWRSAKGKSALTHCTTCGARFHLRIPRRCSGTFLALGASRWVLHFLAALLMFVSVQLLAVGWGYLLGRSSDLGELRTWQLDLSTRRALFCYCVGIWEVLFVIVVSHNSIVLRLDNWLWRGSYFGATSVLQYSLFPLAMECIFQACEAQRPSALPLLAAWDAAAEASGDWAPPLNMGVPLTSEPGLEPIPLSCICSSRPLELGCGGAACSLYVAGVVLSVALGLLLGGYAGYGLLNAMEAQAREVPASLVQEFEVVDFPGDYAPPTYSATDLRLLSTLHLLS